MTKAELVYLLDQYDDNQPVQIRLYLQDNSQWEAHQIALQAVRQYEPWYLDPEQLYPEKLNIIGLVGHELNKDVRTDEEKQSDPDYQRYLRIEKGFDEMLQKS